MRYLVLILLCTLLMSFDNIEEYEQYPDTIDATGKSVKIQQKVYTTTYKVIYEHIDKVTNKSASDIAELTEIIIQEATAAGYDPCLITSIIHHESTFNQHCIGAAREVGLMQVHPCHRQYNRQLLRQIRYNIQAGIQVLKAHHKSAGSLRGGLRGYTGGRSGRYDRTYALLKNRVTSQQNRVTSQQKGVPYENGS